MKQSNKIEFINSVDLIYLLVYDFFYTSIELPLKVFLSILLLSLFRKASKNRVFACNEGTLGEVSKLRSILFSNRDSMLISSFAGGSGARSSEVSNGFEIGMPLDLQKRDIYVHAGWMTLTSNRSAPFLNYTNHTR